MWGEAQSGWQLRSPPSGALRPEFHGRVPGAGAVRGGVAEAPGLWVQRPARTPCPLLTTADRQHGQGARATLAGPGTKPQSNSCPKPLSPGALCYAAKADGAAVTCPHESISERNRRTCCQGLLGGEEGVRAFNCYVQL